MRGTDEVTTGERGDDDGSAAPVPPVRWSARRFWLALSAFGLLSLGLGYLVASHLSGVVETAALIARPHDVQSQLEHTLGALDELQDSVQDFVIDGADGMLAQYDDARREVGAEAESLARIRADELAGADLSVIRAGIDRLLDASRRVVTTRRLQGADAARRLLSDEQVAFDDTVRPVREAINQQKALLRMHEASLQLNVSRILKLVIALMAGGVLATTALVLDNDRRRQVEIYRLLRSENERLEGAVRERSAVLARANRELTWFSQRALQAQEQERRALALELHDQVGQDLAALALSLSRCLQELPADASGQARQLLEDSIEIARASYSDVHNLALDLRPAMLDRLGLVPTLQWYLKRQARTAACEIGLETDQLPQQLAPELAIVAFRIVQEAVSNAVRHASARRIDVLARLREGRIELTVRDNGAGFDPDRRNGDGEHGRGLGLAGMRQRAEDAGGTLSIRSRPGEGTTIVAVLPLGRTA